MLWTLLLPLATADAPNTWRFVNGGELDGVPGLASQYHGILDFGWRRGPWSAELMTDTLDVRFSPAWERGRAWVGLRGAGFAANMWIAPWTDGAPDPARALAVAYVGPDFGAQRYLPGGLYVGAEGFARHHVFLRYLGGAASGGAASGGAAAAGAAPPPPALWLRGDAVAGLYRESGPQLRVAAGADWDPVPYGAPEVAPHVNGSLRWRPGWAVAPIVAGWAGWAQGQDDLTSTRVGGLTPYHPPLGGAAWAEFWVEDYAVGSLGLSWLRPAERSFVDDALIDSHDGWRVEAAAQLATVDDGALGFELRASWWRPPWFAELRGGYAPGLTRQGDHLPLAVFYAVGFNWTEWAGLRAGNTRG